VIQQQQEADGVSAAEGPLWWRVLEETAAQANSCETELGELVLGARALLVRGAAPASS
jgi:hypothetical protein